jgi:hypothetical protein
MAKALLLLGILLILIDLYENLWLRRNLKAEDEHKITGGHLFRVRGVRIYRSYLGGILILLWLLVR